MMGMEAAIAHLLMLAVACLIARLGWFMTRKPEKASRWFMLKERPVVGEKFAVGWTRMCGWLFTVSGCLGVLLYVVLIPFDLLAGQ